MTGDRALPTRETETVVGELKNRQEATDALYRFALGLDLQGRELLESPLAADAELDSRSSTATWGAYVPVMVGRDTIVNLLLGMLGDRVDTTHAVTDPRVQVDGGTARLTATVQAQHLLRADHNRQAMLNDRYAVDLVHDGARWVMDRIHIDTVWYTGDPAAIPSRDLPGQGGPGGDGGRSRPAVRGSGGPGPARGAPARGRPRR